MLKPCDRKCSFVLWDNNKQSIKNNEWGFPPEDGEMNLQTQDSKLVAWWYEAEHATSRSRRFPTRLNLYE